MAYIDKVTTMRRLACIHSGYKQGQSNGAIVWEGVNIEGDILIKNLEDKVLHIQSPQEFSGFMMANHLEVVYQDPETEEYWEPRQDAAEDDRNNVGFN